MTLGTSGAVAAGLAALVSGIAIYIAVLIWAVNRARTSYSAAIIRRLKGTDQPVVIQASDRRGIWNPAGSEVTGRLFVNGRAVYTIDDTETVHLDIYPSRGAEQHYEGPIPVRHNRPETNRVRRLTRAVWVVYLAVIAAGFVTGYLLANGSQAQHLIIGVIGLFLAALLMSLAPMFLRVGVALKSTVGRSKTTDGEGHSG